MLATTPKLLHRGCPKSPPPPCHRDNLQVNIECDERLATSTKQPTKPIEERPVRVDGAINDETIYWSKYPLKALLCRWLRRWCVGHGNEAPQEG